MHHMLHTHTNSLPAFQRNFPSDRPFTTKRHGTVLGFMESIFNDADVDIQYHLSTRPQLFLEKTLAILKVRRGYDLMALLNPKRLYIFFGRDLKSTIPNYLQGYDSNVTPNSIKLLWFACDFVCLFEGAGWTLMLFVTCVFDFFLFPASLECSNQP